jgi:hypothetical protein
MNFYRCLQVALALVGPLPCHFDRRIQLMSGDVSILTVERDLGVTGKHYKITFKKKRYWENDICDGDIRMIMEAAFTIDTIRLELCAQQFYLCMLRIEKGPDADFILQLRQEGPDNHLIFRTMSGGSLSVPEGPDAKLAEVLHSAYILNKNAKVILPDGTSTSPPTIIRAAEYNTHRWRHALCRDVMYGDDVQFRPSKRARILES